MKNNDKKIPKYIKEGSLYNSIPTIDGEDIIFFGKETLDIKQSSKRESKRLKKQLRKAL